MLRNIFLALLVLAFMGLSVLFFYKFNEKKEVQKDYFAPIPTQSAWVMVTKKPRSLMSTLKGTNIIYDELVSHQAWNNWRSNLEKLDSLTRGLPFLQEESTEAKIVFALVPSGANNYDVLASVQGFEAFNEKENQGIIKQVLGHQSQDTKDYDGSQIKAFDNGDGFKSFLTYHKGFWLLSTSQMVVEDAVRQLNSGISLMQQEEFRKISSTAGSSRKVNWYVQQAEFIKYCSIHLREGYAKMLKKEFSLSSWVELDLWLKPNSVMFNGYTSVSNDKTSFLNVFNQQSAGGLNITEMLPVNTAFFTSYSISNYPEFIAANESYWKQKNSLTHHRDELQLLLDSSGLEPDKLFKDNVGSEIGFAVLEVQTDVSAESYQAIRDKSICILRLKNSDVWVDQIVPYILANESDELYKAKYREIPMYEMGVSGLVAKNLGGIFSGLNNRFFAVLGDYVVYAEKLNSLREVINAWKGGKTLDEDENYELFKDNLASTSNITMYCSPARSPYLITYFLKNKPRTWLNDHIELFRKFEGLAIQIAQEENDLFYYSVFLKHNPIYKKVTSSLWEIPLDTNTASSPQLFVNHYTKAGEILIQDVADKIYLISNTGRVLWSRQVEGQAISKFYQVDKFKNDKFQILFNTSSHIYLIDRNGKNVDGFPIKLAKEASGPLSLMDYEGNRKYRLLQPIKGGAIQCYNIDGKIVKGWKYKGKKEVTSYIQYMNLKNKDYLVLQHSGNGVRVLNRKGEDRIRIKTDVHVGSNSSMKLLKGKTLDKSYIISTDSNGNVLKLSMTDKSEVMQLGSYTANHYFNVVDLNDDQNLDYVFQGSSSLIAYDQEGKLILEIEPDFELSAKPSYFKSRDRLYIALLRTNKEEINLYDHFGSLVQGSPFFGASKPLIYDINLDNRLEFVSASKQGMIYCYIIE